MPTITWASPAGRPGINASCVIAFQSVTALA
jgi:hypothetical protein